MQRYYLLQGREPSEATCSANQYQIPPVLFLIEGTCRVKKIVHRNPQDIYVTKNCLKGWGKKSKIHLTRMYCGWTDQVYSPRVYLLWNGILGKLQEFAGSGPQPTLQRGVVWLDMGKIPSSHDAPCLWAKCVHQTSAWGTSAHRAAPSASLQQGDETEIHKLAFTVVIIQPSSSDEHHLVTLCHSCCWYYKVVMLESVSASGLCKGLMLWSASNLAFCRAHALLFFWYKIPLTHLCYRYRSLYIHSYMHTHFF